METTAWREFPEHGIRIYAPTSPGDRYRILFRDAAGKERERSGGKSERTALERAQALARELATGVDGTWTVGRLLDEYVVPTNHRTRRGRPWGDRYAEEEARRVRLHIRPQLDLRKHPDKLEPQDFIRVLNVAGVGRQESTVETIGKTCRAIISYGQRRRVITGDPMLGVHYTVQATEQDGDAQRIDPATIPTLDGVVDLALYAALKAHANAAEARRGRGGCRIVDVCGPLGRALQPLVIAGTGMRYGEHVCARADWFDIGDLDVHVQQQWVEPGGKAPYEDLPKHGKTRHTTMAGWLAEPLGEYIEMRVKADGKRALLWPAPAGGRLSRNNHSRWWLPVRDAAGWDPRWSFRGLRHLYGVTCLAPESQGGWEMTLEDVSRLMGHHSPHFTSRRYLTVRQNLTERAAASARRATI